MNTANTYKCPKCNGSGFLSQYSGIANGVCFSCEGNGFKIGQPVEPMQTFSVYGVLRATGEKAVAYNVRAKSAAEAIAKALKTFAKASEAYRAQFDMAQAEAA
jgi:hypothetical protein